jgi:hypothetical protein|tara:strand:+ start:73 stop:273 length:201 start_codon:yes stop_codon:yes gene_type:complete
MKDKLVHATKSHLTGMFDAHIANVHVYMANPAGIGEHSDIIEAIEIELDKAAKYKDMLEVLKEHIE